MSNGFRDLAANARRKTNNTLEAEIAKLTPLTQAQLAALLPEKEDKVRLAELMAIVESATTENNKVASLTARIQELGPVVVRLLKVLALP